MNKSVLYDRALKSVAKYQNCACDKFVNAATSDNVTKRHLGYVKYDKKFAPGSKIGVLIQYLATM